MVNLSNKFEHNSHICNDLCVHWIFKLLWHCLCHPNPKEKVFCALDASIPFPRLDYYDSTSKYRNGIFISQVIDVIQS